MSSSSSSSYSSPSHASSVTPSASDEFTDSDDKENDIEYCVPRCAAPSKMIGIIYFLSMLCMIGAGTQYGFSGFSPDLKSQLNYTQSDIETVGELGNVGQYLGPITGILANLYSARFNVILSSSIIFFGYFMVQGALRYNGTGGFTAIAQNPELLGFFYLLAGFGGGLMYSATLNVNVNNTSLKWRAVFVAILVSTYGLSASLFTGIYTSIFNHDVEDYILFMAITIIVIGYSAAPFLLHYHFAPAPPPVPSSGSSTTLSVAVNDANNDDETETKTSGDDPHLNDALLIHHKEKSDSVAAKNESNGNQRKPFRRPRATCGDEIRFTVGIFTQLIKSKYYWLLFFTFYCISGPGLMQINNTGHQVQSLNNGIKDDSATTLLILVLSICNGLGRLALSSADFIPIRRGWYLVLSGVLMSFAHFLNAFAITEKTDIYAGVIFSGLAYGLLWASMPIIISELWSRENFASNFGWVALAPGLSSISFNSIAGKVYDDETPEGANNNCIGTQCLQTAYIVNGCASIVGAFIALFLIKATKMGGKNAMTEKEATNASATH